MNRLPDNLQKLVNQAGQAVAACFAVLMRPKLLPILAPALIFIFAFIVRAAYVLQNEHRVIQFGDAYYYLTTGAEMARAVATSTDWGSLFAKLTPTVPISTEDGNTFLSVELPTRLVLDGPIYPAYLALLANIFGFASQVKADFDNYNLQIGLANSFIDVLSCMLIYFLGSKAMGRKVGALAAILFAIYPAAVINQTRAYGESFAYFLVLSLMSVALLARVGRLKTPTLGALAIVFGLLCAAVALARPVFILVVGAVIVSILLSDKICLRGPLSTWYQSWCGKRRVMTAILAVAGAAMIFFPWTQITEKALGKPTILLARAPAYNLFVGNQVVSDGWKTWPIVPGFSGALNTVIESIADNLQQNPLQMIALEFKKLPRLWAGGWNEFRYSFFGISFDRQNAFHCMLLLFAFVGICVTAARIRAERSLALTFVGLSAFFTIVIHFLYVGFEPISRYAITAMPFACLFAAVTVVSLLRRNGFGTLALMLVSSSLFFALILNRSSCAPIILQTFPSIGIFTARFIEELVIILFWFLLARICLRSIRISKDSAIMPRSILAVYACFGVAAISWFAAAHFDMSKGEWFCDVRTKMQTVSQEVKTPPESELAGWLNETKGVDALDPKNTVFLLVDFEHDMGQPGITLTINRTAWRSVAMPWYQVLGKTGDIPTIMNMQGNAMGRDWRSFRQWWAIPIPRGLLKTSGGNEIAIGFDLSESPTSVRVFGDYFTSEGTDSLYLPSFELFSWTRGFATYDTRDTRIYELTHGLGEVTNPALWFTRVSETKDLSPEPGLQNGAYRIRIAVPRHPSSDIARHGEKIEAAKSEPINAPDKKPEPLKLNELDPDAYGTMAAVTVAKKLDPVTILGGDPRTYNLFSESQKLPSSVQKGSIIDFGCILKSDRKRQSGPITVVFEGDNDKGEKVKWSSPWQPTSVACDTGWRRFHASYVVPDEMLALKNLSANVMISPFPTDELVLKKSKALREVLVVKDSNLTVYTPLKMPSGKVLDWMIF